MQTHAKVGAIADALIPRSSPSVNIVVDAGLIVGFAALTAVLAKVAVYLNPAVPITGQTFGVLMAGAVLGSKRGAASMLVYLGYGIAGIPVFAPEAAMSGLSRGYLLGFVAAAFIVGLLVERGWGRNPFKLAAAMFAGEGSHLRVRTALAGLLHTGGPIGRAEPAGSNVRMGPARLYYR